MLYLASGSVFGDCVLSGITDVCVVVGGRVVFQLVWIAFVVEGSDVAGSSGVVSVLRRV